MKKVFLNGVFDLLTPGHFNLLTFGRQLAGEHGKLIVAIDEDEKVMGDKGLRRPIFDVIHRGKALLDLRIGDRQLIDHIDFFSTNLALLHLVRKWEPDIIVKGSDWEGKTVVGSDFAEVVFFPRMEYSTTEIVQKVIEKHKIL